jgi:hypothetical protein
MSKRPRTLGLGVERSGQPGNEREYLRNLLARPVEHPVVARAVLIAGDPIVQLLEPVLDVAMLIRQCHSSRSSIAADSEVLSQWRQELIVSRTSPE